MESFSYKELSEAYTKNWEIDDILCIIKNKIPYDCLSNESKNKIKVKVKNFVDNLSRRYKSYSFSKERFNKSCKQWLEGELKIEFEVEEEVEDIDKNGATTGRPSKLFQEMSERSKRRKLKDLNDDVGSDNIKEAFMHQLKSQRKYVKAEIIENVITATPSRTRRILNSVPTPKEEKKFTPEEALALFLDLKLSKHQYSQLRQRAMGKNVDLFPAYHDILSAKKECYPSSDAITVTETSANVELKNDPIDRKERVGKVWKLKLNTLL